MSSFLSSLYILETSPVLDVEIFSHSVGYHFVLLTVSFALQKLLSFMWSYLLIIDLSVCATGVLFRKLFPVLIHAKLFLTFSFARVHYNWIYVESLIHLNLSFVQGDRYGSICILLHADIQLGQHHLLKILSFLNCIVLASLLNIK